MPYTCAGGDFASGNFTTIPSGNYASITVTGVCNIQPDAVINVVGNINVAPGAVLDAQSAPSTITVGHNVTAGAGSLLGMGCQPANTIGRFAGVPCAVDPTGHTTITVHGNVTATDANTVLSAGADGRRERHADAVEAARFPGRSRATRSAETSRSAT